MNRRGDKKTHMHSRIFILVAVLLIATNVFSQTSPTTKQLNSIQPGELEIQKKVDEYIRVEMEQQKIPGISLAVIRNGEIIYAKGYGLANVEHQVPVKPGTVFQSGSVGKAFTVMAVMMLVEEGRIALEDTITKYFTDGPPEWKQMTIRHVLEHTSGLMTGYPKDFDYRKDYTEDDLYALFKTTQVEFKPGEKRGYSNIGFEMLGFLIRKVTGKFYGDFLKEKIFDPLGMSATRIISEADIVPNRAAGYRLEKGELKNQDWVAPMINTTAAGSLYTNTVDIAKWEAAINSGKLLKPSGYAAMWKHLVTNDKQVLPFGFSWQVEDIFGKNIVEHSGGWQGFTANFSRYPEQKTAFIIFTNLRGVNPVRLCRGVQETYHPELSISGQKAIPDNDPKIAAYVREILRKIVDKQLTSGLFVPPADDDILPYADKVSAEFKSFGTLHKMELIHRKEKAKDGAIYQYRLDYGDKQKVFILGLTKDMKIYHIDLVR